MWTLELIVMASMIAANSVFAAYEIALASVGFARLDTLVQQGRRGAKSALRMKSNMEASLAVVQLGITLVAAIAAATGGSGAEQSIQPALRGTGLSPAVSKFLAIGLVVVPLTVVTIIFGELVPKVFALRNREWVCLQLSRTMELFSISVWPAVWFFENSVTWIISLFHRRDDADAMAALSRETARQELRALAAFARTSRLIGRREEGIIVNAVRLSTTPLEAMMLPREYVRTLAADATLTEALAAARREMHTRYPVTKTPGDPDGIIGYVNFKDIVAAEGREPRPETLREILRELPAFAPDTALATCLERLIRRHTQIALVRDADERVVGMLTLEDILEELVGEIHDEYDQLPTHLAPAGEGWVAGGNVTLERLEEVTGIHLPPIGERPIDTLHEWILETLGRPPQRGDRLDAEAAQITVRKVRRQVVQEARISPPQDGGSES